MNGQKKRSIVLRTTSPPSASTPSKNIVSINKTDADIVELSRCCICFETYSKTTRVPISMPCGHTFCRLCVYKVLRAKTFHCCVCRVVSIIGFGGLNKNLALIQLLEKLKLLEDDDGTDPIPPAGSYCVGAVSDQVYANIELEAFDHHSHFYLGLIKGFLQYQIDAEVNYLSPEISTLSDAVRQVDKASNALKLTFAALRDSSSEDVDNASIQNFVTSPFAGTLPDYDIDELYPGIDFEFMRNRIRPTTVGNDLNEVRMAWVPVTNGDLTLFRVFDASDYQPDSYSQSGGAAVENRNLRPSELMAPLDFHPGQFHSNSRILPPSRNSRFQSYRGGRNNNNSYFHRNPVQDHDIYPYHHYDSSFYGSGIDYMSWVPEPHQSNTAETRNYFRAQPGRRFTVVNAPTDANFTSATRVQQIWEHRRGNTVPDASLHRQSYQPSSNNTTINNSGN